MCFLLPEISTSVYPVALATQTELKAIHQQQGHSLWQLKSMTKLHIFKTYPCTRTVFHVITLQIRLDESAEIEKCNVHCMIECKSIGGSKWKRPCLSTHIQTQWAPQLFLWGSGPDSCPLGLNRAYTVLRKIRSAHCSEVFQWSNKTLERPKTFGNSHHEFGKKQSILLCLKLTKVSVLWMLRHR